MSKRFVSNDRQGGCCDGYYVVACDKCNLYLGTSYNYETGTDMCESCTIKQLRVENKELIGVLEVARSELIKGKEYKTAEVMVIDAALDKARGEVAWQR